MASATSSGASHSICDLELSSQSRAPAKSTWLCSSVPTIPGSIALTRTPLPPSSARSCTERWLTNAFVPQYTANAGKMLRAAIDETFTRSAGPSPAPAESSAGLNAPIMCKRPLMLRSICCCHCSTRLSSIGLGSMTPALFTTIGWEVDCSAINVRAF